MDSITFNLLDFDKETQGEYILTVLCDDKVIGFISVWIPTNFIHHLYIDESFHKRGIGKELLKTVIEKTGLPIRLKCLEKNTDAIQFYKKLGFEKREKGESENGSYYVMKLSEDIE
nr:GNAT family N-acetyltransferase [Flavobacterium sp. MC2016-06]